ncbi:MAG TPA: ABC transporter permease [Candidatus Binataceae bacterium]|nr:ABC transporter permease [Candidatus Binataceae bacterium]
MTARRATRVASQASGEVTFARTASGECRIQLAGAWRLGRGMAQESAEFERALTEGAKPTRVSFDASRLGAWDSALATILARVGQICAERAIAIDYGGLPEGLRRLLELAGTTPLAEVDASPPRRPAVLERAGTAVIGWGRGAADAVAFIGEVTLALGRVVAGRARYRAVDVWELLAACGGRAVGIVALISFLVGVILAFMGAVQLERFGASIYVADLVAIGVTRDMGAMMTAIIMAGRTGAAFAAQLGTMKVRQEVEALETMGISPIEFLVAPRVIALVLMMPLLCLYADFIGILGGASIGVGMLHINLGTYLNESAKAIYPTGVLGGLFKSLVYGILIAIAGCYRGIKCGNSAAAVGEATTAAVVDGIILVVVACGLFSLVFHVIGV